MDAMVTGRMPDEKKRKGSKILQRESLSASQAVNMMYDRLLEDGNAAFLTRKGICDDATRWKAAATFVDGLPIRRRTRFDDMTDAEIKMDRLKSRGLAAHG